MRIVHPGPQDLDALHAICQAVSSNPNKPEAQKRISWLNYVDYYPLYASDTSFMAVDEDGKPMGYLLCAPDFNEWKATMEKELVPQMAALDENGLTRFQDSVAMMEPWQPDYPAHLHIDVLPEYQSKHVGSTLMKELFKTLAEKGIPGIQLGVSATRPQAIAFYKRNGFEVLEEDPLGLTMGKKISD